MATMATERVFIDTNVLIRANVRRAPLHAEALHAIEGREHALRVAAIQHRGGSWFTTVVGTDHKRFPAARVPFVRTIVPPMRGCAPPDPARARVKALHGCGLGTVMDATEPGGLPCRVP